MIVEVELGVGHDVTTRKVRIPGEDAESVCGYLDGLLAGDYRHYWVKPFMPSGLELRRQLWEFAALRAVRGLEYHPKRGQACIWDRIRAETRVAHSSFAPCARMLGRPDVILENECITEAAL